MAEFLYHLPISDLRILRLYFILSRNLLVAGGGPTTTALKLLEEWNKSVNNGTKIKYYVVISVKVHFICFFYFKPKNFHSVPHREYFLLRGHAHCSPVEWKMKSEKYPTSAKRWCCKSSQLCVHLFVCFYVCVSPGRWPTMKHFAVAKCTLSSHALVSQSGVTGEKQIKIVTKWEGLSAEKCIQAHNLIWYPICCVAQTSTSHPPTPFTLFHPFFLTLLFIFVLPWLF